MAAILYIADPVVTEDFLNQQHQDQEELCVSPQTVITPTGWDYIRRRGLHLSRGEVAASRSTRAEKATAVAKSTDTEQSRPASIEDAQMVPEGRCDHSVMVGSTLPVPVGRPGGEMLRRIRRNRLRRILATTRCAAVISPTAISFEEL